MKDDEIVLWKDQTLEERLDGLIESYESEISSLKEENKFDDAASLESIVSEMRLLYEPLPARLHKWQRLTNDELKFIALESGFRPGSVMFEGLVRAIEARLKEQNKF